VSIVPTLRLLKDQERRLLAGHDWVYSNEVDVHATPLKAFEPGERVAVVDHRDRWLGYAHVNPRSLICARILSRDRARPPGPALWEQRLRTALTLRDRLYAEPFYRMVFSEGDALPGLIVDRYDKLLAVQLTTAGMERERSDLLAALEQLLGAQTIVLRNDLRARELEGLSQGIEVAVGEHPGDIELPEGGARYRVSPLSGQKTGWFYDQADNRARLARYATRDRVLDVCSYIGAWGISSALQGASQVSCVDASAAALERLTENAARNGVSERIRPLRGDAFEVLRGLRDARERFALVILDPPAFVKRRKDLREGTPAYRRLNGLALDLLAPDGVLVTCSCSHHMDRNAFLGTIQQAARRSGRRLQLLETGQQGPDHPVHPAIPETAYLKAFFLRALPAD